MVSLQSSHCATEAKDDAPKDKGAYGAREVEGVTEGEVVTEFSKTNRLKRMKSYMR